MSMFTYFFWLVAFIAGVAISYFVPETTVSIGGKFIFVGAWGAVLGLVLYNVCKRKLDIAEEDFNEALYSIKDSKLSMTSELPVTSPDPLAAQPEPEDMPLPTGAISSKEALAKKVDEICVKFPLDAWKKYTRCLLKDRPVPEVIKSLEELLPQLFPNASGILYMYAGTQTDLHKVLSFGETVISDDVIRPVECASFDAGDIVIADYSNPSLNGGCTHLHLHPHGVSFCAPIEGSEEHFGIFSLQTDVLPDNESMDDWHAKVSAVATTLGLYVANQNLSARYRQHSIRDSLTGLFNRRYMEESLVREVSAATRHRSPIGLIMLYPDAVAQIQEQRGRHAVEQLLWELGQRLPGYVRNEDIPCRYEGEVFCVILPGADLKITRDRAERIRHEISQLKIAYGETVLETTLSIGVAVMPVHAGDARGLLMAAGESMQMAIQSGANRVILADALGKKR
ncbi:diguanylate cyclase (GGDEF) domain-containing protein [Fibrobacter sp. UWT2]|uniref:GGDEF domain-containing protein n=1 Tax=Fibrobacter sp. UWT2 TaxID=1896224 RepID=UPI0009204DFA|nr:GGDEF domain-containing protein [Fibrobacter sp. UWT2]SHL81439.1 diguanylate cyclase (GGDEF) domain-containing protein [Fibrobacter sp. UWT2]